MFLKVQMPWNAIIPAEQIDAEGLLLQKAIVLRLMQDFVVKKAAKELGYLLAVSSLDNIGEGRLRPLTGDVLFPITFSCLTFKIFRGEILEGVVHLVMRHGVFLRCGPVTTIFLSAQKMPDYRHVPGESPMFISDTQSKNIEKDVVVRFMVIGTKWIESEREFQAVVSIDGDFLGPV